MNAWLVACSIYNLGFAIFHLLFWKIFHWKQDLAHLKFVNRNIMQILNLRLTYVFLMMAFVTFVFQAEMTTRLGLALLAAFSIFWFMRAVEQIIFFGLRNWISNSLTVIFLIGGVLHLLSIF